MKPVLYRYKDTESVIKRMDGYTPGEGWEPLYSQDQISSAVNAALKATAPEQDAHPDDKAVDRFAGRMKWKLAKARARGKSGWQDRSWTPEQISAALRQHVDKGDPTDVANYCMFLSARGEPITPATAPEHLDPADLCDVCKEPVRYGSRHHACGEAMLRAKANAAPATAPEKTVQEIMEFARHYAANTFSSATLEDKIRRSLAAPATALVVTKNESGQIVAVTRQDEDGRIVEVLAESAPATAPKQCWCQTCRPITQHDNRMVLCPDCGNKRCPKATDHRNACTGSNEPGQPGSSYPTVPATAPDWHDVQPPFGSIRNAAMAIYRPPFRFVNGYVYDNQNHVVADHDNISEKLVTGSVCARVRGWGRIGYMPNAAKLQDEVGALIADALNEYYAAHPQIPEDKP